MPSFFEADAGGVITQGCSVISHTPRAHTLAAFGPYVIVCIGPEAGAEGLDAFSLANAQVARKFGRLGHLVIFCSGFSIPSLEERASVADVLRSFGDQVAASAVVLLESRELRAIVLRSLVPIIGRIGHVSYPQRMFGHVSEAALWLSQQLPEHALEFPAAPLTHGAEELVRAFG